MSQSTLSPDAKAQVILAAVNAVGPADPASDVPWSAQVAQKSAEIYLLAYGERSAAVKALNGIEASKVFTATVLDVKKEQSSTRGLVSLKTRPSTFHPDGVEQARTERTDDPSGRAIARALKAIIGHRVLVWVEVEEINNGASKVRVIRHFEDLGPDTSEAD